MKFCPACGGRLKSAKKNGLAICAKCGHTESARRATTLVGSNKGRCEADWKLDECPHYLSFEEYDEHKRGLCTKNSKCEQLEDGKLCPYYRQKWDVFRAPTAVANYPFLLSELRYTQEVK